MQRFLEALLVLHVRRARGSIDSIDLNGDWAFGLDTKSIGAARRWYQQSCDFFTQTIKAPGSSIGSAGFGPQTAYKKHSYTGESWYCRSVAIPSNWSARMSQDASVGVVLSFGGVMRSLQLWANGRFAGEHYGYMDMFVIDLTAHAQAVVSITLIARVSGSANSSAGDCLSGCFDQQIGSWSGIWGDMSLQLQHKLLITSQWQAELLSRPWEQPSSQEQGLLTSISAVLGGSSSEQFTNDDLLSSLRFMVTVTDGHQNTMVHFVSDDITSILHRDDKSHARLRLSVRISNGTCWSPENPVLYQASVLIIDTRENQVMEQSIFRFGLRIIQVEGPYFMLNGKRHFLLGIGDDFGYSSEAPPMDYVAVLARFKMFKQYGFNYVRLHSHFEAPQYFAAADEAGFFISPALPSNDVRASSTACAKLLLRTWNAQIAALKSNPSVMDVSMGNEFYGDPLRPRMFAWAPQFHAEAKRLNPVIYVLDTDGCCWTHGDLRQSLVQRAIDGALVCPAHTNGTCDRSTNDFMTPFFEYTTPLIYPDMYNLTIGGAPCASTDKGCAPAKPIISHEMGNFNTFPNLQREIATLEQTNWRSDERKEQLKSILELGFTTSDLDRWVVASQHHVHALWKYTVEFLRLSPYITGHEWWLFQDWYGASNGLVNWMFEPKGGALAPDRIVNFVDPVVILLANGIVNFVDPVVILLANGTLWAPSSQTTVYASSATIQPAVIVSNFGVVDLRGCFMEWEVFLDSNASRVRSGDFFVDYVQQGSVSRVFSSIQFQIDTSVPLRFVLKCSLHCPQLSSVRRNDWAGWVVPDASESTHRVVSSLPIYAASGIWRQLNESQVIDDLQPWPLEDKFSIEALYIIQQTDLESIVLMEAVMAGAKVLMLDWDHTKSAPQNLSGLPMMSSAAPVIFHAPTWLQTHTSPTANLIPTHHGACTPESFAQLAANPSGSAGSGWADSAFFPTLGPARGRCSTRHGTSWVLTNETWKNRGCVWLQNLLALNIQSPSTRRSTFEYHATVFDLPVGNGHAVVSGLDLDLGICLGNTKASSPGIAEKWIIKALVESTLSIDRITAAAVVARNPFII